jgi:hypothetical protein
MDWGVFFTSMLGAVFFGELIRYLKWRSGR